MTATTWVCSRCGSVRTLEVTKGGPGTPACATCQTPMGRQPSAVAVEMASRAIAEKFRAEVLPGMAEALAKIDRED